MSTVNQDAARARQMQRFMHEASDVQVAERIANHYTACTCLAFDLRSLIAVYRDDEIPEATREMILHMRKEIERHHLEAFGTTIISGERDD